MKGKWKEPNREKNLFKSYYCLECKQRKVCGKVSLEYCCFCALENEKERAKEYSNYEKVLASKKREQKERFRQLELLKDYLGCKVCGSKEIDAYSFYEKNKLVCWTCLVKKEGKTSSPISFSEQSKWYKRFWKVDLAEWLTKYQCLSVNKKCADKWLKDKGHLGNCACLEQEAKELYLLFANSLRKIKEKLRDCKCEISEKVRVGNDYCAWCERCEKSISVASKKRVIKNRNDPRFWGLEVKEKVLCLKCLSKFWEKMPNKKKYVFNKYLGRYGE